MASAPILPPLTPASPGASLKSWSFQTAVTTLAGEDRLRVVTADVWNGDGCSPESCVGCGSIVFRPPLGSMVDEKGRKWHMPCRRTLMLKDELISRPLPGIHKDSVVIYRYLDFLLECPSIISLRQFVTLLAAPTAAHSDSGPPPPSEKDILSSLNEMTNFLRLLDLLVAMSNEILLYHREAVPHDSELSTYPRKAHKTISDLFIYLSSAPISPHPLPLAPDLYTKFQLLEQTILLFTLDLAEGIRHLEHDDEVSPQLMTFLQRLSDTHNAPQEFAVADWGSSENAESTGKVSGKGVAGPDTCVVCRLRVMEECISFNGQRRWHSACLRCSSCGLTAREGGDSPIKSPTHSPSPSLSHAHSMSSLSHAHSIQSHGRSRPTSPDRQIPTTGSSSSLSSHADAPLPHPSLALILQHCVPSSQFPSTSTSPPSAFPPLSAGPGKRPTPQRSFTLAMPRDKNKDLLLALHHPKFHGQEEQQQAPRISPDVVHWRYEDSSRSHDGASNSNGKEDAQGYSLPRTNSGPVGVAYCPRCTPPTSGFAEGFEVVPLAEQYLFLMDVSLQRLYRSWVRRGLITPLPVGVWGGWRARGLVRKRTVTQIGGKIRRLLSAKRTAS